MVLGVCVRRVEVHLFLGVSSVSVDSSCCHIGKEGIWMCGFNKA